MSETGTYVRYTQELFTNKFAMQAMMQNNQDVASENAELLFKYGLVRCTCGVVDDERNSKFKLSYVWEFKDKASYDACGKIIDKVTEKFEPSQTEMPRKLMGENSVTYFSLAAPAK